MTDAAAPMPDLAGIPASIPATDPLAPYDAVLLLSYGGPRRPEDVLPFMRNATAGDHTGLGPPVHRGHGRGRQPGLQRPQALDLLRDDLADV